MIVACPSQPFGLDFGGNGPAVGSDFVVGVGPAHTTLKVSVPPHQDQGQWKMTVDGVELTRKH